MAYCTSHQVIIMMVMMMNGDECGTVSGMLARESKYSEKAFPGAALSATSPK
jgi:hypothetical protein